jgi:hypothetical protein
MCRTRRADPEGTVNLSVCTSGHRTQKMCVRVSDQGDEVIRDHACVSGGQPGA